MQHLIEYLHSEDKAADYFRHLRWPGGVSCPHCGSPSIKARERCDNGLQRYHCPSCAAERPNPI